MRVACWKRHSLDNNLNLFVLLLFQFPHPPTLTYLWGVVTTDDRAERLMDQKRQGVAHPPGSALVGEISDGSQDLF